MERLGTAVIDEETLKRSFLVHFRKKLSQTQISQRMGYAFNQYGKWETGSKQLHWDEFLAICAYRKIEPMRLLLHFYDIGQVSPLSAAGILDHFCRVYFHGDKPKFARFLGVSTKTLERWFHHGNRIAFMTVLKCLSFRPQLLLAFLDEIGLLAGSPVLKKEFLKIKKLVAEEARMPFAPAVQYFLLTQTYLGLKSHDSKIIARALDLTVEQVDASLQLSLATDLVRYDGTKYSLNHTGIEYKSADRSAVITYFRYWTARAMQSLVERSPSAKDGTKVSGVRVYACSREAAVQITGKLRETYLEIARIIDEDKAPRDFVRALVLHHFDPASER